MSITTEIKDELYKLPLQRHCCALAECLGMILYATSFSVNMLKLQSQSPRVNKRITQCFKLAFGFEPELYEGAFEITEDSKLDLIFQAFGYERKSSVFSLNRAIIEDECCKQAFLRGIFLIGGYLSTPEKGYHLELVSPRYQVANQVMALLDEMELSARYVMRRGTHVLYYKDSTAIENFISTMGATNSAMTIMLMKVERDLRNKINRKVNCETANISKTIDAAAKQIDAIEKLKQSGAYNTLNRELKQTADIRCEYPELSLSELCAFFTPEISKPGLNNRIRKLIKLAGEVK